MHEYHSGHYRTSPDTVPFLFLLHIDFWLTISSGYCYRHPDGPNKGRHKLYEGEEKSQYTCKYCGQKYSALSSLTSGYCYRHPDGTNKGRHAPAR